MYASDRRRNSRSVTGKFAGPISWRMLLTRAFELLCASCERRGLVLVGCPDAKEGAVFYDRDPSWQHELVSSPLTHQVAIQWSRLTGKHYVSSGQ